ncbi:PCMD domain-containing protein [Chitinophaga nivalis]|uniref:PCMD domain-containing protein n=1 Tax=Chitinophaga nivalis TaxID=2991709 RepID=A0ABT3ITH3_9BACT|nr:PCMD domain-containing protein [Chitinophaga nivalis]MCW3463042.1 PCMD domain-containing protein [Chitinophaga nivalis]MCW3487268.1 PCMD domain-containing protein [Chitinophaga nivalis]
MRTYIPLKHTFIAGILLLMTATSCKQTSLTGDDIPSLPQDAAAAAALSTASLPNAGFESQNSTGNQPLNWLLSSSGASSTTDAHSGRYAAKIWNWYYYAKGYLTNGDVWTGGIPGYDNHKKGGIPIHSRPTALTGYYKYEYGTNNGKPDSAIALIALRKFNPATQRSEKVAYAEINLGPASQFRPFTLPIRYDSQAVPDSVVITFISSRNGFCNSSGSMPGNCLYLTIDDLALTGAGGSRQPVTIH